MKEMEKALDEKIFAALVEQDKLWEDKHNKVINALQGLLKQQHYKVKLIKEQYKQSCCASQAFAMFPEFQYDKVKIKLVAETISMFPEYMYDKIIIQELSIFRSKYPDHSNIKDVFHALIKLEELNHV